MRKNTSLWTISELMGRVNQIDFPEYQREPTIWTRAAKQRLVDSIVRQFDISALYLYQHHDELWDCVDGRQRISAIRSFLGGNPHDVEDNGFVYKVMNEIFDEDEHPFRNLEDQSYVNISQLAKEGNEVASLFVESIAEYPVTVVILSDSAVPEEFNLQFTRLNLGQLIISGEKLNAMVGELRNLCFDDLGQHDFLSSIDIPTRRYAREQLAAQIVAQVIANEESRRDDTDVTFARVRHLDLQRLFKVHSALGPEEREWVARLRHVMDLLATQVEVLPSLRSRSIVLSLVLLAYEQGIDGDDDARGLAEFAACFVGRLKWQVGLGIDANDEYRYLNDFQRHLTQASVERYGIRERANELDRSFAYWREHGQLIGDEEYRLNRDGQEPQVR